MIRVTTSSNANICGVTEIYTLCRNGGGLYKNQETGLKREFSHKPHRGKWVLIAPRRIPLYAIGYPKASS